MWPLEWMWASFGTALFAVASPWTYRPTRRWVSLAALCVSTGVLIIYELFVRELASPTTAIIRLEVPFLWPLYILGLISSATGIHLGNRRWREDRLLAALFASR